MNSSPLNACKRIFPALLLACSLLFCSQAQAADVESENQDIGKPFASVWRLRGDVFVTSKLGVQRKLQEGGAVLVGEQVRAAPNSEAVLKTGDAGIVAVRPGAEFVAERFAAEGKTSDRQILRLLTGSLRVISGWIGKINRNDHRILTPAATIGIRGTDHEPYVLPADMANTANRQGTYDKVNRGGTTLDANGGSVDIDSGRVGFARDANAAGSRSRALMTILLPVLLSKVPEFYVPGAFDQELDQYSEHADVLSQKQLFSFTGTKVAALPKPDSKPSAALQMAPVAVLELPALPIVGCPPATIGKVWLARFDGAIARSDIKTILGLFAPDIVAKATVRSGEKVVTLEFGRAEMVQSTLNAIASLKDYQQRRVSLEAALADGETEASCKRINVKSIAIEQGLMNGKPYRFEALEDYLLEQRNGEWLAVTAHTTQR